MIPSNIKDILANIDNAGIYQTLSMIIFIIFFISTVLSVFQLKGPAARGAGLALASAERLYGGKARIGFENNLLNADGSPAYASADAAALGRVSQPTQYESICPLLPPQPKVT